MKGLQYEGPDDPTLPVGVRSRSEAYRAAFVADFNERWAIVSTCEECGDDLVASELASHRLAHAPARFRSVARTLYELPPHEFEAVVALVRDVRARASS